MMRTIRKNPSSMIISVSTGRTRMRIIQKRPLIWRSRRIPIRKRRKSLHTMTRILNLRMNRCPLKSCIPKKNLNRRKSPLLSLSRRKNPSLSRILRKSFSRMMSRKMRKNLSRKIGRILMLLLLKNLKKRRKSRKSPTSCRRFPCSRSENRVEENQRTL